MKKWMIVAAILAFLIVILAMNHQTMKAIKATKEILDHIVSASGKAPSPEPSPTPPNPANTAPEPIEDAETVDP